MPVLRWSFTLITALLSIDAQAQGIAVGLPSPSPCPANAVVSALSTRLGDAMLRVGEASLDEVRLTLRLSSGRWSIELLAPGQPPLSRPLAVGLDDCVALSEATALIAERYLASIAWTSSPGEVRPLPPPPRWQARLALSGGAVVGGLTGVAPMAQLELGATYAGWALEVSAAYLGSGAIDLMSTTQPASAFQSTGALGAVVSRSFEVGPGALRVGLAPGLELYWVGSRTTATSSPNPLPHPELVVSPLPFIGAQTGYELHLAPGVTAGLRLQVRAHPGTLTFVTEGYAPRMVTAPVTGDLAVVVGAHLF